MGPVEGFHKIGLSANPEKRLAQIAAVMPIEIRLAHLIESNDMAWLEAYLHVAFRHCRGCGEWFRLSPEDFEAFITIRAASVESDLPAAITERYARNDALRAAESSKNETPRYTFRIPATIDAILNELVAEDVQGGAPATRTSLILDLIDREHAARFGNSDNGG